MKVVLIGLGMVAETHLAAINEASGITLAGVLGRRAETTTEFARKAEQLLGYDVRALESVDEIADESAADFAILATPPDARSSLVEKLADAGIPILMEKPLERTLEAAETIVAYCEDKNVQTGVFFQNRTRKAAVAMRQAVLAGDLGDLIMADIRVPWWRDQSYYDEPGRGTYARDGGGVLINQAIHTIDLALWALGQWKDVQAKLHKTILHRMESEDWASALFETASGVVGTLTATTAAYPGGAESITLHGSKAFAHLEKGVLRITHRDGTASTTGSASMSGGGADPMAFTHAWHQRIIEDFSDCLKTGREPIASARSALMSHAVIDAMERSHKSGQRVMVTKV